jgi:predicted ATPase
MITFAPMKHLVIRNLGPLKEADIELKRINVIIGSQSSGKSCVLKTACYCTWVEKRIQLTQTADFFAKDGNFLNELERFHKLKGYIKADTFISYESDFMAFSYDNATKTFTFNWKGGRWDYRRSKVTYIPAERNLVAAIPNWFQVKFADDNIRDFMADWETARQATTEELSVLNLGVSYHFDANTKSDKVQVAEGVTLDFTNTSSGLQSVIPLYVHLHYLFKKKVVKIESFANIEENSKLLAKLNEEDKKDVYDNYVHTYHCDIFLEEPEANLFPPTQSNLVEWLLTMTTGEHPSNLFIATHSPYILNAFMEKKDIALTLLYTRMFEGQMTVKTATEQDIQDLYDYGVDAFFNIESLG